MDNKGLLRIAYQIALAINTAFIYYAALSIMIFTREISAYSTSTGIRLSGPRVVIFDFGLARDKDFTARQEESLWADNETELNCCLPRERLR
jgi:hypothetical protein